VESHVPSAPTSDIRIKNADRPQGRDPRKISTLPPAPGEATVDSWFDVPTMPSLRVPEGLAESVDDPFPARLPPPPLAPAVTPSWRPLVRKSSRSTSPSQRVEAKPAADEAETGEWSPEKVFLRSTWPAQGSLRNAGAKVDEVVADMNKDPRHE
jgi:hypothetical protein